MIGSRLGPYEITAKLGEGGMGEVWRAKDSQLGREIALKVLPEAFTADPERAARFEREAKLLASLNHPNIAQIYGLETSGDSRALVMELVEGPTLAERLEAGSLSLDESLSIAHHIAEALEEAHEKGIIHRDLKPQNVKASLEGKVKVLDFGLAKAMDPEGVASGAASVSQLAASPTLTLGATVQGVILGTAAYMAPEQAKGFAVDKRADIWAFGVVLYEMLTGGSLFAGDSVPDTLARVLQREIDFEALPASTPRALRRLVRRCLERDPKRRLRDIGEARVAIDAIVSGSTDDLEPAVDAPGLGKPRSMMLPLLAGAALGALAVFGLLGLRGGGSPVAATAKTVKFRIELSGNSVSSYAPIAPDGRTVAWSAGDKLWVRRLDEVEPWRIDLPWNASAEAWTRDGKAVVVRRRGAQMSTELWRVATDGGAPKPIGALPSEGFLWGVSPGEHGELYFGMAQAGLYSIPAAGGAAQRIVPAGEGEALGGPFALPGGRGLLFAEVSGGRIEAFVDGERKVVLNREGERYFDPLYSPTGHLLFRADGGRSADGLWAVPFSLDRLEATGEPFRLLSGGWASISLDGTLTLRESRPDLTPRQLVEVDRRGAVARTIGEPLPGASDPAISPDGGRVALAARSDDSGGNTDLYVIDRQSGARYRLRDDLGNEYGPAWTDGGRTLVFATFNAGIRYARSRSADGSGDVRLLADRALVALASPDAKYLVTSYYDTVYRDRSTGQSERLFDSTVSQAAFSPDGRWLAYVDNYERSVFLRRFPSGDRLTPVTSEGTQELRFGRDGRELFLAHESSFAVIPVDLTGDTPQLGEPRVLFDMAAAKLDTRSGFDVTPEGHFLMMQSLESSSSPAATLGILVVQNWASEVASQDDAGGRR